MVQIKFYNAHFTFNFTATSFQHGVTIATSMFEKMGLINKMYIESSCGNSTWIR